MQLQRQRRTRLDRQPFHLETVAGVHPFIIPPRTMDAPMGVIFRAVIGLEPLDHLADMLGLVLVHHQHGIRGFDHHQVVHADGGDKAVLGDDQHILRSVGKHVALQHVAAFILRGDLPQRRPGADIGPAGIEGEQRLRDRSFP